MLHYPLVTKVARVVQQRMGLAVDPGNHAVIVFDRAAWHTTKKLYCQKTLLPLPPASPELNPTEQVW